MERSRNLVVLSVVSVLSALFLALPAVGQEADPLKDIAPLLTSKHIGVIRVDVAAIDLDAKLKELDAIAKKAGGEKISTTDEAKDLKKKKADFLKAGGKAIYVLVGDVMNEESPLLVVTLDKKADPKALAKMFETTLIDDADAEDEWGYGAAKVYKGLLLLGKREVVEAAIPKKPAARADLAAAMQAAGNDPIAVAIVPPKAVMKDLLEGMPELPEELGGGETAPLGKVKWLCFSASQTKTPLQITIKCESAAAAKNIKTLLDTALKAANELISQAMESGDIGGGMTWMGLALMTVMDIDVQAKGDTVVASLSEKKLNDAITRLITITSGGGRGDE